MHNFVRYSKNYVLLNYKIMGQNGQIPSLAEIFSNLPLFVKYLAMYHPFKTRVRVTRVPKKMPQWHPLTWIILIKKGHVELEFVKLKFLVMSYSSL